MSNFFTQVVSYISSPIFAALDGLLRSANTWVGTWIIPFMALVVAIWAISMAGGMGRVNVHSYAKMFMFIALISALLSLSVYTKYLREPVMTTIPDGIGHMIGSDVRGMTQAWDIVLNKALDAMWSIWNTTSWRSPVHAFLVAFFLALYLVAVAA